MQQRPSSTACRLLRMPVSRLAPDDYKQAVIDAIKGPAPSMASPAPSPSTSINNPVKQTAILTYVDGKPVLKEMF